jgi:hypothetical protein
MSQKPEVNGTAIPDGTTQAQPATEEVRPAAEAQAIVVAYLQQVSDASLTCSVRFQFDRGRLVGIDEGRFTIVPAPPDVPSLTFALEAPRGFRWPGIRHGYRKVFTTDGVELGRE